MGANRVRIKAIIESGTDKKLVKKILSTPSKYPFFGGTMFWCRVDFLQPLLQSGITPVDFNSERGQVDGTTAHAIERIFGKILHTISKKKMYIIKDGKVSELPEKSYTGRYKHVG
jgi:lipopolysaccharide biosynthesis protein